MARSHLRVEPRPVGATQYCFREIEWDVDISWQLRGLHGRYWVFDPFFFAKIVLKQLGVYVEITWCAMLLRGIYGTTLLHEMCDRGISKNSHLSI